MRPTVGIDQQIPQWLQGIGVNHSLLPAIREIYENQVEQVTRQGSENEIDKLRRQIAELREEEARLGRLLITGPLREEVYDRLRLEWREKIQHTTRALTNVEQEAATYLDDLDAALFLIASASTLYGRLKDKQRSTLLQALTKRIIVDANGTIISHELNPPFQYISEVVEGIHRDNVMLSGSTLIPLGAQPQGAPYRRRSSALNSSSNEFESSWSGDSRSDLSTFLSGLRCEKRNLLDERTLDLDSHFPCMQVVSSSMVIRSSIMNRGRYCGRPRRSLFGNHWPERWSGWPCRRPPSIRIASPRSYPSFLHRQCGC